MIPKRKPLTKEFLIKRYINQYKSTTEIANETKWCRSTIKSALKKHNIPVRQRTISQLLIDSEYKRRIYKDIAHRYWNNLKHDATINRKWEFKISLK